MRFSFNLHVWVLVHKSVCAFGVQKVTLGVFINPLYLKSEARPLIEPQVPCFVETAWPVNPRHPPVLE